MIKQCAVAAAVGAIVLMMACSSCSSGGSNGDGGSGGGSCKNVAICTVVPASTVTSAIGLMVSMANPDMPAQNPWNDRCDYISNDPGKNARFIRTCFASASDASNVFASAKTGSLKSGGTRTDVTGVGDQAFYQSEPTSTMGVSTVKLQAIKGQVVVSLSDVYVTAADDATVKQGLTSIANTLLSQ